MNVTDKSKRTCCAAAWAVLNVEALCSAETDYKIRENTKGMAQEEEISIYFKINFMYTPLSTGKYHIKFCI